MSKPKTSPLPHSWLVAECGAEPHERRETLGAHS